MDIAFHSAGYDPRRGCFTTFAVVATNSAEDFAARRLTRTHRGPRLFEANGSSAYALRVLKLPNNGTFRVYKFHTAANEGANKREKARLYSELKKLVRQLESTLVKVERRTRRQLHIHSREARW